MNESRTNQCLLYMGMCATVSSNLHLCHLTINGCLLPPQLLISGGTPALLLLLLLLLWLLS